jgi:demethylspheroidene O-methyltransferase
MPAAKTPDTTSLRARFRQWRNRQVASPTFQRRSLKIPFVKSVARRKADRLFELTAGFVYSQILFAAIELDLFERLNKGPATTEELAEQTGMASDPLGTLLRAAQNLELITRDDDGFWWLDDLGVVLANDPGIIAMIKHHDMLYRDLSDPVHLLKNRGPDAEIAKYWAYPHDHHNEISQEDAATYSELMRVSQSAVAGQVLEVYDFSSAKTLVDVGGGHGAFLKAIGSAHSHLDLHLFDLPQVAEKGRDLLANGGFNERITAHGGSFFEDSVPKGFDCYSLIRVMYDHDDERVLKILSNIFNAMPPGSTLVVAEPMDGDGASERLIGAYFALYLWAMGSGRCRTTDRIGELLTQTGFTGVKTHSVPQPLFASVVTARKG